MNLQDLTQAMVEWVWSMPLFFLLLGCGLLFSIITKFVQWRILVHGYSCVAGHYDRAEDTGHLSHFQALCAALSATIGLGNIAGVAVAVTLGGPGAAFWMWIAGLLGMTLKFAECSLAVMFRDVRDVPDPSAPALMEADAEARTLEYAGEPAPRPGAATLARGEVRGGPMWYIQKGIVEPLRARGNVLWVAFKALAVLFAIATMLNSFGGGNMFQGWNVSDMLRQHFGVPNYTSAVIVATLVALVIIGGIRRIGLVAGQLVPVMCIVYVLGALVVILLHADEIPYYLSLIVRSAFTPAAGSGAFAGTTVWLAFTWGIRRACFSNEAGEGSAPMAHAVAKTEEPIREGVVAGLEPFIDTMVICTMSALVMLMSGAWNRPALGAVASVTDREVIVRCAGELPSHMEPLYLERLKPDSGNRLSVHVERSAETGLAVVAAPIRAIDSTATADQWSHFRAITLDVSALSAENRARIAVGQPVHLDMDGAQLMGFAFNSVLPGFGKYIVTVSVCLFAFSTMISWSYYGEKGAEYLLGPRAILPYKFVFVIFVFLGMVMERFDAVYNFSDATTGLMVLCNLPAVLVLSPTLLRAARSYFRRLDAGRMPRVR
jgi:AGCS family alanine or glycine:cation symporter